MKHLILSALMVFSAFSANAESCKQIRAAFDIGSGSTKLKVYRVDTCVNTIIEQVKEVNGLQCGDNRDVAYKSDMEKNDGVIPQNTIQKGVDALGELIKLASDCGAHSFSGVATSAFRQAVNGDDAIKKLSSSVDLKITKITQEKEAELGFNGALLKVEEDKRDRNICVWDIGGSSMQIVCRQNGNISYYPGTLASVAFRNKIMQSQEHGNPETPNPISEKDFTVARSAAFEEAEKIRAKLGQALAESDVYGIGGVHQYAVAGELEQTDYKRAGVLLGVFRNMNKTDDELGGGSYVDTAVSNMILVFSLMKYLDIDSVRALDVNLTEGLAVSKEFWEYAE